MKNIKELLAHFGFFHHRTPIPETIQYVNEQKLQELYNNGDYEVRLSAGQLTVRVASSRHIHPPKDLPKGCIYCASSLMHHYLDAQTQREVARLHFYQNPDGSIGAWGKKDPKFLVHNGIEYHKARTRIRQTPPKPRGTINRFFYDKLRTAKRWYDINIGHPWS